MAFDDWVKITQPLTKCSSFSQMLQTSQRLLKSYCYKGNGVHFERVDPQQHVLALFTHNSRSLTVCVSLFATICMVAEQLCMTNRAWCLRVVGGELQGKLSPHKDIWLFKACTVGWSPVTGMCIRVSERRWWWDGRWRFKGFESWAQAEIVILKWSSLRSYVGSCGHCFYW